MPGRTLEELVDDTDPMWPIVQEWLACTTRPVEVLPVARHEAQATLLALNVTTRSPLGAMAYETGGILVDSGWLRLLGSSSERLRDSLLAWNGLHNQSVPTPPVGAFIVAHDVLGGFFAVNLGAFGDGPHDVFYFAPDTLRWEDLEMSHADLLCWALDGDTSAFYSGLRWPGWEQEVSVMSGDQGLSLWPALWTGGVALADRSRRVVPQRELWALHRDMAGQLADLPARRHVHLRFASAEPPTDS